MRCGGWGSNTCGQAVWEQIEGEEASSRRQFLISGTAGPDLRLAAALVQKGAVARVGQPNEAQGVEYVFLAPLPKAGQHDLLLNELRRRSSLQLCNRRAPCPTRCSPG